MNSLFPVVREGNMKQKETTQAHTGATELKELSVVRITEWWFSTAGLDMSSRQTSCIGACYDGGFPFFIVLRRKYTLSYLAYCS